MSTDFSIAFDSLGEPLAQRLEAALCEGGFSTSLGDRRERFPVADAMLRYLDTLNESCCNRIMSPTTIMLILSSSREATHWLLPEFVTNARLYPNLIPVLCRELQEGYAAPRVALLESEIGDSVRLARVISFSFQFREI